MNKTKQEIREEVLTNLASSIGINIEEEGSIALAIVDALVDEIYMLHRELESVRQQAYLTTSTSSYTERIAELVNIERREFESDDNLKIRAHESVFSHAGGNIIAIKEAARAVSGVADIDYRKFSHGTGSFVVFVYPEAHENQYRLIDRVTEAINEVVSEGIYYEVRTPEEVPVSLELVLNITEGTTVSERNTIREDVEREVRRYLNTFEMNDILYINEVIARAMSVDEKVLDVNIIEYLVGGVERPLTNTYPANEERYISGEIKVN